MKKYRLKKLVSFIVAFILVASVCGTSACARHIHSYGEWKTTVEPTCTEKGKEQRVCSCGDTESRDLDALGHDIVTHQAQDATCTKAGNYRYETCSRCDYTTFTDSTEIPAPGHKIVKHEGKEATCDEDGYYAYETCERCDYTTYQEIKAHGHVFSKTYLYTEGYHYYKCEYCDAIDGKADHIIVNDYECSDCDFNYEYTQSLTFELNADQQSYSVTGASKTTLTKIVIPDNYLGKPVTNIKMQAFMNYAGLQVVIIGNNVTDIARAAFWQCADLETVVMGNSVQTLAYGSFVYCPKLKDIQFSGSLRVIDEYAFYQCTSLESVELANAITTIGQYAFSGCTSLDSVTIGNSPAVIASFAFYGCSVLTSVAIGDGDVTISASVFYDCAKLSTVTIGDGAVTLEAYAFYMCAAISSVTIGDGQAVISSYAFYENYALETVSVGGEAVIEKDAFYYCTKLTNLSIGDNIASVAYDAFSTNPNLIYNKYGGVLYLGNDTNKYVCLMKAENTSITSCTIPDTTAIVMDYAFRNCTQLASINVPNSVRHLGVRVFYGCSKLKSATLSNGITAVPEYTFYSSGLQSITIPDCITTIGANAFAWCGELTHVTIGAGVKTIENDVFSNCNKVEQVNVGSLENWLDIVFNNDKSNPLANGAALCIDGNELTILAIPDGTEAVNDYAFIGSRITSVHVSKDVSTIGYRAFYNCTNLQNLSVDNENTHFRDNDSNCIIDNSTDTLLYGGTNGMIPSGVKAINEYAFAGKNITQVTIPEGVITIGEHAFDGCNQLDEIAVADTVTDIGAYAFAYCPLAKVTVGKGVERVGSWCFATFGARPTPMELHISDLSAWCNIEFADEVANPLAEALTKLYVDNKQITELIIPEDVEVIKDYVLCDNNHFTSIHIPASVTSIASTALKGCPNVMNITVDTDNQNYFVDGNCLIEKATNTLVLGCKTSVIPQDKGIVRIGDNAFYNCMLESVTLPSTVTEIGEKAFYNCRITSIELPANLTTIGAQAFVMCKITEITIPAQVNYIGENAFNGALLTSVTFNNPSGWQAYHEFFQQTEYFTTEQLSNTATAAEYLTATYKDYVWTRN